MIKKLITLAIISVFLTPFVTAKTADNSTLVKAEKYYRANKFEQAINEYQKTIIKDTYNKQATQGISSSYKQLGDICYQDKEFMRAVNYYRSAMFYIAMYSVQIKDYEILQITSELHTLYNSCMKNLGIKLNAESHYYMGELLFSIGEYAAAGFEYSESLSGKKFKERAAIGLGNVFKAIKTDYKL